MRVENIENNNKTPSRKKRREKHSSYSNNIWNRRERDGQRNKIYRMCLCERRTLVVALPLFHSMSKTKIKFIFFLRKQFPGENDWRWANTHNNKYSSKMNRFFCLMHIVATLCTFCTYNVFAVVVVVVVVFRLPRLHYFSLVSGCYCRWLFINGLNCGDRFHDVCIRITRLRVVSRGNAVIKQLYRPESLCD